MTTTAKQTTKKTESKATMQELFHKVASIEETITQSNEEIGATLQVLVEKIGELTERLEEQKKKAGNPSNTFQVCRRYRLAAQGLGFTSIANGEDKWDLKGRMSDSLFAIATEYAEDNGRMSKNSIESFLKQYGQKTEDQAKEEEKAA